MNFCFRRRIALLIYFGSPSWNTALTCSVSIWRPVSHVESLLTRSLRETWSAGLLVDLIYTHWWGPVASLIIYTRFVKIIWNLLVFDTVKHICQVCIHCRWVNSTPPLGKVPAFIWCFLLQTRYRFKIKRWYSLWLLLRSFNRSLVSTLLASKNRYISTLTGPPNSLDHYEASWDFDEIKVA